MAHGVVYWLSYTHETAPQWLTEWCVGCLTLMRQPLNGSWSGVLVVLHSRDSPSMAHGVVCWLSYTHETALQWLLEWCIGCLTLMRQPLNGSWSGVLVVLHTRDSPSMAHGVVCWLSYTHETALQWLMEWCIGCLTLTRQPLNGSWSGVLVVLHSRDSPSMAHGVVYWLSYIHETAPQWLMEWCVGCLTLMRQLFNGSWSGVLVVLHS